MFDNKTMATICSSSKLPVLSNGPVDSSDDELEKVYFKQAVWDTNEILKLCLCFIVAHTASYKEKKTG